MVLLLVFNQNISLQYRPIGYKTGTQNVPVLPDIHVQYLVASVFFPNFHLNLLS